MIKAIIYDCDGTVIDSRQALMAFYGDLFAAFGVEFSAADPGTRRFCTAHAARDVIARYAPSPTLGSLLQDQLRALDYSAFASSLRLEPHILETLAALRPAHRLAIATNREGEMAVVSAHFKLERHVDLIVTAADVPSPKPDPGMLLAAAERLDVAPSEALMVGDTVADARAAAAAGMPFIAYASAERDRADSSDAPGDDLVEEGALAVIDDHRRLPGLLHERWGNAYERRETP